MFELKFWKAAGERAGRTFAQTLVAALGAGAVNIVDMPWVQGIEVSAGAGVLSLLTSVAFSGVGPAGPGTVETVAPGRDADLDQALRPPA